jgi:hypothetical protein
MASVEPLESRSGADDTLTQNDGSRRRSSAIRRPLWATVLASGDQYIDLISTELLNGIVRPGR